MRDTGVIAKGLSGDTETATTQISVARTQLGILKNQMQLGQLQVGARQTRMADGTVISVTVAGGISRVGVYSPPGTPTPTPQRIPQPHVSQPAPPKLSPQPGRYQVAGVQAAIADLGFGTIPTYYPFGLGLKVYEAPTNGKMGAVVPLTKDLIYRFLPDGSNKEFVICVADASTTALTGFQPELTLKANGKVDIPVGFGLVPGYIPPPGGGLAIDPKQVGTMALNPAWFDTPITLAGTMSDGMSATGAFTVEGNARVGANVAFGTGTTTINGTVMTADTQIIDCGTGGVNITTAVDTGDPDRPSSVGSVISIYLLYPGPRPKASGLPGELDSGFFAGASLSSAGGPFTLTQFGAGLTLLSITSAGELLPGTYTTDGTMELPDGYGNSLTVPLSVTFTITVPVTD